MHQKHKDNTNTSSSSFTDHLYNSCTTETTARSPLLIFEMQPSSQVQKAKISATSDEYVLDQLSICEEKLLKLLEDLDATGKDLGEVQAQMEEEEVGTHTHSLHYTGNTVGTASHLLLSLRPIKLHVA